MLFFLFCAAMAGPVWADNLRPVYLEIEELAAGRLRVVWKVPLGQDLPADLAPVFPAHYRVVPPQKRVRTNDAVIASWEMVGDPAGLTGGWVGIDGLEKTTTDALVRIRLADGSLHRAVLRPTETGTTVTAAGDPTEEPMPRWVRFLDRWRHLLLLGAALALSLSPGARRRGIALCAVALVAGAFSGHALGRLPAAGDLFRDDTPSPKAAAGILQGLMLNTYRAFMLTEDERVYDVLSRSVAGEYLSEIYLQNRGKLQMDDAEGNRAVVHRLDIKSIEAVARRPEGRLAITASWDVYGSVHHRQHVHYRCNTYKAEVVVEPADDYWKIVRILVLDEQRVL